MVEYLSDLRLFVEISKTLNFRQAGEKLGYSPAVVSMRVKRLETVTGKTLFLRSTRHIAMTEEGKELLALAQQTLDLTELMTAPRHQDVKPEELRGTVRITAAHSFARLFLLEPLAHIHRQYPNLSVELLLDDNITQLVREGIDISFRVGGHGNHEEPGIDSHELLADQRILVASPQYLAEKGVPQSPDQLHQHQCLGYLGMKSWPLLRNGQTCRIHLQHALYCNTGDYLSQLARDGGGITAKSRWSVQQELDRGELVRVLPEYSVGEDQTIRALTPKRDVTPVRVRCVLAILQQHIRDRASELNLADSLVSQV